MLKLQVEPMVRWPILCEELNLIVEDVEEENPTDIAYVYSGYAPLSCRLAFDFWSVYPARFVEKALDVSAPFERNPETSQVLKSTGLFDIYSGWHEEIDGLLNLAGGGPAFNSLQCDPARIATLQLKSHLRDEAGRHTSEKVVLIFFLGGCTYAEITACRLIEKMRPGVFFCLLHRSYFVAYLPIGIRIVMATTKIINGKTLLSSFDPKLLRK